MSEAFDSAWALLKMPIVPSSLKDDLYRPTAKFIDPVTGQLLPITAEQHPMEGGKVAFIGGSRDTPSEIRSFVDLIQNDDGTWSSQMSRTMEEYRKRGYATALYDLLARMVHDREDGAALVQTRDGMLLEDGSRFWDDAEAQGRSKGYQWRVRDDL